jgi:hypothetical protein
MPSSTTSPEAGDNNGGGYSSVNSSSVGNEQLAAHFVAEGQITGYTIYTISIDVTIG